jgi:hypothetical protein
MGLDTPTLQIYVDDYIRIRSFLNYRLDLGPNQMNCDKRIHFATLFYFHLKKVT